MVARPLHQALSIFLDAKTRFTEDVGRYDAQINDLCTTLRAIGRRVPFVVTVLRAIQLDIRRRELKLSPETEKLFEDFEQYDLKLWKEDASYLKSMYSQSEVAPHVGQQDHRHDQIQTMGEFLGGFDKLDLQNSNGGRSA